MKLAYVVIATLVALVIAQAILIVRGRSETERLDRLVELDRKRATFCASYRSMITTTREQMEKPQSADDPSFGYLFYHLSMEPFLDVCRVGEPVRTVVARRSGWNCQQVLGKDDYPCLARIARELEAAIPLEQ